MNIENIEKNYSKDNHSTYSCQYHIVFCPKYRRKVLVGNIADRAKEVFLQTAKQCDFNIVEMDIMPDVVHMIVECNPKFGISNCITKLKGISSNILRNEFLELKSRIPTLWTRHSFISTIGTVSLESINKFIDEQSKV